MGEGFFEQKYFTPLINVRERSIPFFLVKDYGRPKYTYTNTRDHQNLNVIRRFVANLFVTSSNYVPIIKEGATDSAPTSFLGPSGCVPANSAQLPAKGTKNLM